MMMDTASAELCKYAANSILATRISFMNEIANVCELVGADVDRCARRSAPIAASARRSCFRASATAAAAFPKDVQALLKSSADKGYDFQILRAVEDGQRAAEVAARRQDAGAFRRLTGKYHRAVGPGVQAAHRRHARGAGDHHHRAAARARRAPCGPTIRRRRETARRMFGDRITLCEHSYDALAGADALVVVTEWNEFREPDFKKMQAAAEDARRVRRPQHLLARADAARSASPTSPLAAEPTARPGDRRRRLHRQPRRKALTRAGYEVVVFDNLVAGHREAVRYGELVVGDITDLAAVRARAARPRHPGGDALRRVSRRRRVGARAGEVLPQQRGRCAHRPRSDGGRGGRATSSSRRPAPPTASRSRRRSPRSHPQQPINSYGESKLAVERALPHFERAYGIHSAALRYFNAAGADPDGEIGEDHSPEIHLIPRAIEAATGGPRPAGVRRRLPDARRHLPARLHPRHRSGRRARQGARRAGRDRPIDAPTTSAPARPHSVREVIDAVERVTGRPVPWTLAPRRAAIRRCCTPRRTRRRAELRWTPRFADLDSDRRARPGTGTSAIRTGTTTATRVNSTSPLGPPVRLCAPLQGAARAGPWWRWWSTPSARPAWRR